MCVCQAVILDECSSNMEAEHLAVLRKKRVARLLRNARVRRFFLHWLAHTVGPQQQQQALNLLQQPGSQGGGQVRAAAA